jgi:hypothetical protein
MFLGPIDWPGRLFFCSIVNAVADGKRLRAIDATADPARCGCVRRNRLFVRQKRH